ncbi:transcription termination factor NusA [Silvanigrella paludirubra]|uniref:Transcription termination/antitermination protein NusA n=1 Tax=Silvanigrella paludirubra TaxID=2499159 RepID=A0A6N6VPJ2_9BACT|nr:transcription termination factor NusA [Silvanigrella paludirubra]KAB8037088.1 transcription termination factor NusA [Silvanigrella paludirubra]
MQIDLKRVIETVGKEKNIDRQLLIGALREAVLTAARKHFGDCVFETRFNEETEEIELIRYRTVVADEDLVNPSKQIPTSEAIVMDDSLQVGDEIGEPLPTDQLGRIAAQAAKQAIVQKVMEAEKEKVVREFRDKKHQTVIGQVRRFDKADIIVDLGPTEGVLPVREQIPGEKYKIRDKVIAFVVDVKKSTRGPQVMLSRAHPELLIRLFEQEVTEISEGIVVIQSAARDPGSRSKIAVYSTEPSIDPVGACVGIKGARVQAIVQELRGEKIDIIPYDRDPARFVCNALAPSEPSKVIVNERLHIMEVVVPDEHLSLAIGKRGQNVRLAAQLTGWKVDIRSESKMRELVQEYKNVIAQIPALGEMRAEILVNEGYKDPADISRMDHRSLVKLLRLTPEEAEQVVQGAAELAATQAAQNAESSTDEDLEEFHLGEPIIDEETTESEEAEAAIDDIVAKTRPQPLLDPEKVDSKNVPVERLRYWMQLKGVAEQIAAVIHTAGFADFNSVASSNADEIAYKTGLPVKLSGKLHAETAKIIGN